MDEFLSAGAESVFHTTLIYHSTMYDNLGAPTEREIHDGLEQCVDTMIEGWLTARRDTFRMKVISYAGLFSLNVYMLKYVVENGYSPASVASLWLDALRAKLEKQSKSDVHILIKEPFMKKAIEIMKNVEQTDEWITGR